MQVTEDLVRQVILDVLGAMGGDAKPANGVKPADAAPLNFRELGTAKTGTDRNEVVVGVPPAFGVAMTSTIIVV